MTKKDLSQNIYTLTFLNVYEQMVYIHIDKGNTIEILKNEETLAVWVKVGGTRGHYAK